MGGWDQMEGQAILFTPNHLIEFLNKNPNYRLSLNDIYILRSFTQFEIRVLEQALISNFKPNLNSSFASLRKRAFYFVFWRSGLQPLIYLSLASRASALSQGRG